MKRQSEAMPGVSFTVSFVFSWDPKLRDGEATFRVGLSQLNLSENALRAKVQGVPDTRF